MHPYIKEAMQIRLSPKKWHVTILLALFATSAVIAQETKPNTEHQGVEVNQQNAETSDVAFTSTKKIVEGTIIDEFGEIIWGANIIIEGTDIEMFTDKDGYFRLDLTEEFKEKDSLIVNANLYGQYWHQRKTIYAIDYESLEVIQFNPILELEPQTLEVYEKLPFHKSLWYRVKNIFRKK